MTQQPPALYTATVRNEGGTAGRVIVQDGPPEQATLPTGPPVAHGPGFNPEQLLAMAWGTCLGETLCVVLREHGHDVMSSVRVDVALHRDPAGGYRFVPRATASVEELDRGEACELLEAAHRRCPVSKLLRGAPEAEVVLAPAV